jgi:hypothetical protein
MYLTDGGCVFPYKILFFRNNKSLLNKSHLPGIRFQMFAKAGRLTSFKSYVLITTNLLRLQMFIDYQAHDIQKEEVTQFLFIKHSRPLIMFTGLYNYTVTYLFH